MSVVEAVVLVGCGMLLGFFPAMILISRRLPREAVRRQLVVIDGAGPIVGKPTRAQWRLRRRALAEAAKICESFALEEDGRSRSGDADVCADRILARLEEYDRLSPEFFFGRREFPAEIGRVA